MCLFCNPVQIPHDLTESRMKNKAARKKDLILALSIFGGLLVLFAVLSMVL